MSIDLAGLPPIRQWHLKNFKSIRHASIDFAPLTLLMGSNSSGKSTLLQSILLLSQAAISRQGGDSLPLNGPLVSLGGFEEALSAWSDSKEIEIGGTFSRFLPALLPDSTLIVRSAYRRRVGMPGAVGAELFPPELKTAAVRWQMTLRGRTKAQAGSANISSVQLSSDFEHLSITGRQGPSSPADLEKYQRGLTLRRPTRASVGQFARVADFSVGYGGTVRAQGWPNDKTFGLLMRAGIPVDALVQRNETELLARDWMDNLSRTVRLSPPRSRREAEATNIRSRLAPRVAGDRREELETVIRQLGDLGAADVRARLENPSAQLTDRTTSVADYATYAALRNSNALEDIYKRVVESARSESTVYVSHARETDSDLWEFSQDLLALLRDRVLYLGPLRQDPQVVYKTVPAVGTGSLGSKGEVTAAVLEAYADQSVFCPQPTGGLTHQSLRSAVDLWMRELGVAESVTTESRGAMGLSIEVGRPGPAGKTIPLDLTNVGVGVSQLLPVIVMCLLATPGSVLLFEQPELHLHPAVQQRLGDFFIAVAASGRQVIIETHSEYLLNRLRLRIAQDDQDRLGRLIAILFAEFTESGTRFTKIMPNRYGTLDTWPDGFFDQSPREAAEILQAALAKRRTESERREP